LAHGASSINGEASFITKGYPPQIDVSYALFVVGLEPFGTFDGSGDTT
jgi:hypothetical protein